MKYLFVIAVAGLLSGCALFQDVTRDKAEDVAPYWADLYLTYCNIADIETRRAYYDEMQKELDEIAPGAVAPKFDCNNNGIPDLDE